MRPSITLPPQKGVQGRCGTGSFHDMFRSRKLDVLVLLLVCAATMWWGLGKFGLTDPDEAFYAQTVREMLARHEWVTPVMYGQPNFEKPIVFYWSAMVATKICGENEFASRAPSALAATLTVLLIYFVGARVFNRRTGFLAGLVLATALLFIGMARLMLTDMVFTAFLCASCLCYWLATIEENHRNRWVVLAFAASALAVLTKGPLGSIIPFLAAITFLLVAKHPWPVRGAGLWWGLLVYVLIAVPWFAVMLWKFGWEYFQAFFIHENFQRAYTAEHPKSNTPWFYLGVIALGSIPWLAAWGVAGARAWRDYKTKAPQLFLWCWLVVGYLFLTVAAQSKLPSYGLFLCIPVAILLGAAMDSVLAQGFQGPKERWTTLGLGLIQVIAGVLLVQHRTAWLPALIVGGCQAVPFVLLLRRPTPVWIAATAANTIVVLAGALIFAAPQIEGLISEKPLATQLVKELPPGEPIVCSRSLARSIYYYTGHPVYVLSVTDQPYYSPHALPVVVGMNGLQEYLKEHQTAPCVFTDSNWKQVTKSAPAKYRDALHFVGRKAYLRLYHSTTGDIAEPQP